MRPAVAVPVLLAACLVASVAVAQNDKISAQFEALAASGVTGEVTLNPMPNGEIQLRSQVKGLAPETEYRCSCTTPAPPAARARRSRS